MISILILTMKLTDKRFRTVWNVLPVLIAGCCISERADGDFDYNQAPHRMDISIFILVEHRGHGKIL